MPTPPATGTASATTPHSVAVVIPIYRGTPTPLETISLVQCCVLLGRHPLVLVCAESLDPVPYLQLCAQHGITPTVERLESHSFASITSYNKLLLDSCFYQRFIKYSYILIYQLDAFVFQDTLAHWCQQGYDYIGAPWFEEYDASTATDPMQQSGGNGGLSLRRVEAFLEVLTPPFPYARVKNWDDMWRKYQGMSLVGKAFRFYRLLVRYRRASNLYGNFLAQPKMFEDEFFSKVVPRIFPRFKVAPSAVGMWFAFESQPRRMFGLTNQQLPFGCHAWERYDIDFWRPFIEAFGHAIPTR